MASRTFSNQAEAIQFAFDELAKISEVCVELRGMIEGHRYALQALTMVLASDGGLSRDLISKMTATTADIVDKIAKDYPDDPTTQLQYGSASKELRALSQCYADDTAPIFTVIQGGKED